MAKGEYLGEFEQIVLVALLRLGKNAYGMAVRREIGQRTGRTDVPPRCRSARCTPRWSGWRRRATWGRGPAILRQSAAGDPTPERGGRAKRAFHIESGGQRALRNSQEAIRKMMAGLKPNWDSV